MVKLVILDRDGVINHDSDAYIKSREEWLPIAGSLEAIAKLNAHGYIVAVATNQSGIARGYYDEATLKAIHDKMHQYLAQVGGKIAAVHYCPCGPDDNCDCRKPKTGMIETIGKQFEVDLTTVTGIGDAHRDLIAFSNAGCKPLLVKTGKGELTLEQAKAAKPLPENTIVCDDLAAAVTLLLSKHEADEC